jgi:hypothetical protein
VVVESSQLTWLDWWINISSPDLLNIYLFNLGYIQFFVQGTLELSEALCLDRGRGLGR